MGFGLLNNDCLWVLDETQLLGVGVETSAQLDAFRQRASLGAPTRAFTWWMSATLDPAQLETVDHPRPPGGWPKLGLSDEDKAPGSPVQKRRAAIKRLALAPVALVPGDKGSYVKELAAFIRAQHQDGTLTLVVLNRVARAREVYQALLKLRVPAEKLALVHSRFRPGDRQRHEEILFAKNTTETDRIVIATQAVEAGVDVSARVLITELAPWPSLVQRFGRCNRQGEWPDGTDVFWIDVRPKDDKDDLRLPYAFDELESARKLLTSLPDVGINALHAVDYVTPPVVRSVIRRKDLLDLFDTTADLLGHDLDVSRYVRDSEDTDVQVFWRELAPGSSATEPAPTRAELCRVSLGDFRRFFPKAKALVWDGLETKSWRPAKAVRPGQIYLLPVSAGGYEDLLGWTGKPVSKEGCLTPLWSRIHLFHLGSNEPSLIEAAMAARHDYGDPVAIWVRTNPASLKPPALLAIEISWKGHLSSNEPSLIEAIDGRLCHVVTLCHLGSNEPSLIEARHTRPNSTCIVIPSGFERTQPH